MSLVRGLTEIGAKAAKKTAPFYSAVDEALANLKRPKGTGAEFLTEVMKTKGVKKAEIADRKLEQAFKDKGKMTKQEAENILARNPPPKISERILEDLDDDARQKIIDDKMEIYGYDRYDDVPDRRMRQWEDEIDYDATQYGDYLSPGGENYREILLKLPQEAPEIQKADKRLKLAETAYQHDPSQKNYAQMQIAQQELEVARITSPAYRSNHWKDDPNVLAHMRVQDRTGPNGEKILHVEEIQSDWHQEGRKKGYQGDELGPKVSDEEYKLGVELQNRQRRGETLTQGELASLNDIMGRHTRSYSGGKVPDAPFKKNWHELAMKRLLNYAADKGYDSIAITPGAEQAKRYSLSKQLNEVMFDPNTGHLSGRDHNGKLVVAQQGVTMDNLSDYIGKEGAQKILQTPVDQSGVHALRGADLEVGGEGMKGFYDQILPSYLNTFGKPYGAQVQTINMNSSRGAPAIDEIQRLAGINQDQWRAMTGDERVQLAEEIKNKVNAEGMSLHNFPITAEMRQQIQQKGLPLYQQIGIPTAGAGAASQMLEQEEPEYGKGGAIAKMALKAAPAPKAPQIIKPSGLTELKKIVEQEKGGYGARRLERAADEIPNLEKLYQEKALREAFTGDNAKALMTMNPADFEKYAAKLFTLEPSQGALPQGSSDDYLNYLRKLQGFRDVPFLEINKREQGTPVVPYISGHEGRHRSRAMTKNNETSSLVRLLPRSEMREPFPRRSQEEYIEALKEELALTGNKVKPENYTNLDSIKVITRPPIDLPDIYAKGGSVKRQVKKADGGAINYNTAPDMSDGGRIMQGAPFKHGGKVNMTTNRDAMFMELSNNKLKRK